MNVVPPATFADAKRSSAKRKSISAISMLVGRNISAKLQSRETPTEANCFRPRVTDILESDPRKDQDTSTSQLLDTDNFKPAKAVLNEILGLRV